MKNRQVILIVDDQTQNIELLEAYLTPQDYEIVTATSGEEALRKLAGNQIDLILLDIIMPGMDGFEVTRRVRQDDMHRLLPIIMVTVLQEAEDRIKGIEAGCDDFISKPIDKTELLARVRSLLKVKAYNDLLSSYRNELESEVIRRTDELKQALENLQQDITERRRVEEKLRESEKKYRLVVDNMADVIAVMDMNLRFTYVSPSIMRLRGYTVEEAMAQTLEQIMTPESLQITAKVFEEEIKLEASGTADPGRSRILELEEYRKDGSNVWIENHVSFIRDETQKPMGIISYSHDITDRKRAEEALRQNEEKYRTILEDIQESYFEVDFTGNFTFFNDSLCRLYGYSKEELMGMNYRHYTDKEQSKELFQTFNKVYNTGEPTERFGGQIIKKDGTKRYVEESVSLQKDSSGKPIGFRGIVRDITERRRAEEAVAENERKFSTLIGNLPGIVYRCDNDREWTMSFLSEGCRDLTGYAPEEIIGNRRLSYNDVINFEHRERIWAEVQTALSKREHYSFEYSITTAAGDVKWVWARGCGIFSPDGEVQALEGFISDITERKTGGGRIRLSEERFRRIFDEGPFGMSLEIRTIQLSWRIKCFASCWGIANRNLPVKALQISPTKKTEKEQGIFRTIIRRQHPRVSLGKAVCQKGWRNRVG